MSNGPAEKTDGVVVFNTLPWTRTDVVLLPERDTTYTSQQYKDGYEYVLGKQNIDIT